MAYRVHNGRLQKLEFLTTGIKEKNGFAVVRDMWVDLGEYDEETGGVRQLHQEILQED